MAPWDQAPHEGSRAAQRYIHAPPAPEFRSPPVFAVVTSTRDGEMPWIFGPSPQSMFLPPWLVVPPTREKPAKAGGVVGQNEAVLRL